MKCIVEVISDTLSKPNPLPISEECLETLRGGTASDLMLGISKSKSAKSGLVLPWPAEPWPEDPCQGVPATGLQGPRSRDGATACPRPCLVLALWPWGCWETSNCLVFIGPSCHLSHMVQRCESKSGQGKEKSKWRRSGIWGSFSFPGVAGRFSLTIFCTKSPLLQMNELFLSFATKTYWRNFRKLLLKV